MSSSSVSAISVLLPVASVSFYVADDTLREDAARLLQDWRFARVQMHVQTGDIEAAISVAQSGSTPDLLVIETSVVDDSFLSRLEFLASHCSENTSAVVIGPVNDVYLYRRLIGMGVSDYLARPVKMDVLLDVVARALLEKQGTMESRVIAVLGSKGGVGTSSIAAALADIISGPLDQKTMLLDAAGGWSYLSVLMGVEPVTSFNETVRANASQDQDALKRMIVPIHDKLSILGTGVDSMLEDVVSTDHFESILNRFVSVYPVVVVDLSGASAAVKKTVMTRAHEIIMVATPTLPALRAARTLIHEIKDIRGGAQNAVTLLLNMVGQNPSYEVSKKDIESSLEYEPSLIVPYDAKVFQASVMQGKRIGEINSHDSILKQLTALAARSVRVSVHDSADKQKKENKGLFGDIIGILKK